MPAKSKTSLHACFGVGLVFVLLQWAAIAAPEVPAEPYQRLAAEDFAEREAAQKALVEWARGRQGALEALYEKAVATDDPEQETRCMQVLRTVIGEAFDKEGEGFVGIQMMDVTVPHPENGAQVNGIRVTHVLRGFPAEKCGVKVNDIILSCQGKQAPAGKRGSEWLPEQIRAFSPGSVIRLGVLRDEKLLDFDIRLVRRPTERNMGPFVRPREQVQRELERDREEYFQRWLRKQEREG